MAQGIDQTPKIGLRFSEKMSGYFAVGGEDFEAGERTGKKQGSSISFEVTIAIEDIEAFCQLSGGQATLEGTISCQALGQNLPIYNGEFALFKPDRETGKRHMTYSFGFTGEDGQEYFFDGFKIIFDDPNKFDLLDDMTRLFSRIFRGTSPAGPRFGAGVLRFHLASLPSLLASFEITPPSLGQKFKAVSKFLDFCYGELRDTYLHKLSPIYHTEYENLILSGKLMAPAGEERDFFFFSGIHDKDFPWGDGEIFWDVALIIRQSDGTWSRYALTDRMIEGLSLDVEAGLYRYEGPLYQVIEGNQVWRSELKKAVLPLHLRPVQAEIAIQFDYEKYPPVQVPFPLISASKLISSPGALDDFQEWLTQLNFLGLLLTPFDVRPQKGTIILQDGGGREEYALLPEKTEGEAEKTTLKNVRWPKIHYHYICALNPASGDIFLKLRTDALRKNRKDFTDRMQQVLGGMIKQLVSLDLDLQGENLGRQNSTKPSYTVEDNLLEINNDHFPTAVLQRRIVSLRNESGQLFYALEEGTETLNLGNINSARVVKVAAVKSRDKFQALDEVLAKTDFFARLEAACQEAGKSKEALAVIVKPNFMFMYSKKDPSTYTDPELVEHLLNRMFERGYRNLTCAEARSTYGTFFTNREVKTVARHIGLSGKNYRIIDLSDDLEEYPFAGKLGKHYVNREWKQADFRIAFAKNKTHSYAFYTLAIKVIYGALPLENKFLEYHHKRDIYSTTIEFIKQFPIHFALIDAHISADGPFGIFADKKPNFTETIIGSEDLVATDWIGATKMGLDPLVSDYMKKAVEAFGKPQIQLLGDRSLYPRWVNVDDVIPFLAFNLLDRNYFFGNLFYSVFSYMEDFFQYRDPKLGLRLARIMADPVKSLFFQKVEKGDFDLALNKKLYDMFTKVE